MRENQEHHKQAAEARQGVIDSENDIEKLITEESELNSKVKELEDERARLEKRLANEQENCRVWYKCKEDYIEEERILKNRLKSQGDSHQAKLRVINTKLSKEKRP